MAETEQAEMVEEKTQDETAQVDQAEFEQADEITNPAGKENLDILLDINMPITINLGKTVSPFKHLLQMGPGSVLQLDKPIGTPAELFVQDIPFATGDIVVVDGCFAVRIKEILKLLPGSVIELDKLAGEPVDLLVRGQRFAQGEVVVVDENFGVRITKILAPSNRAASIAVA